MAGGFSIFAPIFGKAMSDAALGYTQGLLDLPKEQDAREELAQKQALRPLKVQQGQLELDELKARTAKEQAAAEMPPRPIASKGGAFLYNPQTKQYDYHPAGAGGEQAIGLKGLKDQLAFHIAQNPALIYNP